MSKKLLSYIINSCKFFLIFIIFLITIEVCARIDDKLRYGAPLLSKYTDNRLRTVTDGLQHNVPNAQFEKWKNNNFGFRGKDINYVKADGVTRIVVMGTSETYGLYESLDMEWPNQLGNILPKEKYEVINASVVGLSLKNYGNYINRHVRGLKPDYILISVNPYFSGCNPDYGSNLSKSNFNKSDFEDIQINIDENSVKRIEKGFQIRFLSKIKSVVRAQVVSVAPQLFQLYQSKKAERRINKREIDFLGDILPLDVIPESSIAMYQQELNSLVDYLQSIQIKPILLTYPTLINKGNIDLFKREFAGIRYYCLYFSHIGMADISEKFSSATIMLAEINNVSVIELADSLPKDPKYFADLVHYTDEGASFVAEKVAEYLIKK